MMRSAALRRAPMGAGHRRSLDDKPFNRAERAALRALLLARGRPLDRAELSACVAVAVGVDARMPSIERLVRDLRAKLGPRVVIRAVRGVGYRLIMPRGQPPRWRSVR